VTALFKKVDRINTLLGPAGKNATIPSAKIRIQCPVMLSHHCDIPRDVAEDDIRIVENRGIDMLLPGR
jgi:hypothetical protein